MPGSYRTMLFACFALLTLLATTMAMAEEAPVFDIPRVTGITVDGDPSDWGTQGYRVELMIPPAQVIGGGWNLRPSADFDPAFRLGWNDEGLLFVARVRDNALAEAEKIDMLWSRDSLEIYLSAAPASREFYQMVMAPGGSEQSAATRHHFYDYRASKDTLPALTARVAGKLTADGYILEALLPWSNLPTPPVPGGQIGIQLMLNDVDDASLSFPNGWTRMAWFPRINTHSDPSAMHTFRLAEQPSLPVMAAVHEVFALHTEVSLRVVAPHTTIGQTIEMYRDEQLLLNEQLVRGDDGRATTSQTLELYDLSPAALSVRIDGQPVAALQFRESPQAAVESGVGKAVAFERAVFQGETFPQYALQDPVYLQRIIGPYTLKGVTFYDADYRPVTVAEKPGRYGAVVEIVPEFSGRPFRSFHTLYRTPEPIAWPVEKTDEIAVPDGLGVPRELAQAKLKALVERDGWGNPLDDIRKDSRLAVVSAALREAAGTPDIDMADPQTMDRQWWVGLKRTLYGTCEQFSRRILPPLPVLSGRAPVVREGTLEEAGMRPDAAEKIDAVLQQWAAEDTGEAFAVCVVRHGVIVLHKAYGTRDGKPMTVDTPSWMASMTKLLGGVAMLTAMEQTGIKLDDPAAKYLPALRDIPVETPVTIRHLYTHTADLSGHWGDYVHNFEEIIALMYPRLKIGTHYEYGGTDMALCGKIIETVSGEAMPNYYQRHLLDPLGCEHTTVSNCSYDGNSVPLDLAKVGQLLLNKGEYGNRRFFSDETFLQLLPTRLRETIGLDTDEEYGMGTSWYRNQDGLGPNTFGHGAASGMTFRVDPDNDLVIVMTRGGHGKNFETYHPQFIRAVVDGMAK